MLALVGGAWAPALAWDGLSHQLWEAESLDFPRRQGQRGPCPRDGMDWKFGPGEVD